MFGGLCWTSFMRKTHLHLVPKLVKWCCFSLGTWRNQDWSTCRGRKLSLLQIASLTTQSCTGHLRYVRQQKKFLPYCSVMRVTVILGCHVHALWVPICNSEGHCDMAMEPAKPLTPSHWWVGNAAGSHYRSPPHWLIRLIPLIESHPSPTVLLWEWEQTER